MIWLYWMHKPSPFVDLLFILTLAEMLENAEFWSNYSHVHPSQCQMEDMEPNQEQGTVVCSEANPNPYDLLSNGNGEKYYGCSN